MSEYALLLILTISIPLLGSFENRVCYVRSWPALFTAFTVTATPFIIWDILFTRQGVWHFNEAYTGSITIASLPLEEWLFFFAIPFSSLYIYRWVVYGHREKTHTFSASWPVWLYGVGGILVITAFIFHEKSYTSVVFLLSGLALFHIGYTRPLFIKNFMIAFLITLIPFFLVNGYLTAKPVVLYNNSEILGFRLGSVPFEDLFYCFLLLYMNTWLFETFSKHLKRQENAVNV